MTLLRRHLSVFASLALLTIALPMAAQPVAAESSASVPPGFSDDVVWSGLTQPTVVAFASTGRIFVAQKNGKIRAYSSLTDTTGTQIADLSSEVYNYWDRGLLGLAVDPNFGPSRPYLYVAYTYDRMLNDSTVPRWNDACPTPPGPTSGGCTASARLSRLTVSSGGTGNSVTETPMIWDWCSQFPSHTIGTVTFGPEGALYVSGGDAASFTQVDYGQLGVAPCSDPANEGGALRSQDVRTTGDPTGLDGTIIRIDPDTGDAWPTNANAGNGDANKARIIAYGLRNPFRLTTRADGNVWIGDVGYSTWEEIDKISDPDATPRNFGWPCYEGNSAQPDYAAFSLPLCTSLSSQAAPEYTYNHSANVVSGDGCTPGSSSISGMAFRGTNGSYPNGYDNGLFFTDYTRKCIWFVPDGGGGNPDFGSRSLFANLRRNGDTSGGSVYVGVTPGGNVIYADYDRGEVRMITYDANNPPNAEFSATPDSGLAPLHVVFDASASSDPDDDALTYAWDLDGDGQYDDATGKTTSRTYTSVGGINVGLKVTDTTNQSDTAHHVVSIGMTKPVAVIDSPDAALTWVVGDHIGFSGTGTDAQDGDLPPSAFHWELRIEHCPSNCHEHIVQDWDGVDSGSFDAPNHDYPSHLRLILTVTDSDGQTGTKSVDIFPKVGHVDAVSDPSGIPLTTGSGVGIVGGTIDVSAPASVVLGEETWAFDHWSDGGARAHAVTIQEGSTHLKASYAFGSSADASDTCSGSTITSPDTTWRPGRLASGTDVDWYRFTNTSTRTVRIVLGDLPKAASLKLYKGCSTLLATSDNAGTLSEEIIKSLAAGTYAVKVTSKGSSSNTPYYVRISRLGTGVSIISTHAIVDDGAGTLRLVGELWNAYGSTRGPITVTAKLYDTDGKLLATRVAPTFLYAVARSRTAFSIPGSLPDGFASVKYTITAPGAHKSVRNVSIHSLGFAEVSSRWQAKGTLKATGGTVKTLKMTLTLYDTRGNVVDVVRGTIPSMTLLKNHTTSYLAWSSIPDLGIDRARIRAFGFKP